MCKYWSIHYTEDSKHLLSLFNSIRTKERVLNVNRRCKGQRRERQTEHARVGGEVWGDQQGHLLESGLQGPQQVTWGNTVVLRVPFPKALHLEPSSEMKKKKKKPVLLTTSQ